MAQQAHKPAKRHGQHDAQTLVGGCVDFGICIPAQQVRTEESWKNWKCSANATSSGRGSMMHSNLAYVCSTHEQVAQTSTHTACPSEADIHGASCEAK